MRKCAILITLLLILALPVSALDFQAPEVTGDAASQMPEETGNFAKGLLQIGRKALLALQPELRTAAGTSLSIMALTLLTALAGAMPGRSEKVIGLVCAVALGTLLLKNATTLINLGTETVRQLSDYGKLLLPVMTAALAAQGGTGSAAALYAGTAVFDTVLSSLIGKLLVPLVYVYLALAIANAATGEAMLKKLRDFVKWLMTWSLKTVLYIFTGYMSITGVVSGVTDAATVKAVKLTISGAVPVVGGILADASEAVILSAGVMKSAVGVYGLLAVAAIWLTPFLKLAMQYLLLKLTAAVCAVFGVQRASDLVSDFSGAMGILLGMTGAVSLLLLISTVCMMKGMGT